MWRCFFLPPPPTSPTKSQPNPLIYHLSCVPASVTSELDASVSLSLGPSGAPQPVGTSAGHRCLSMGLLLFCPPKRQVTAYACKASLTNCLATVAFVLFCCCAQPAPQCRWLHSASSRILSPASSFGPALLKSHSADLIIPQALGKEDVPFCTSNLDYLLVI